MTLQFNINYPLAVTGPQAMFRFKEHLKTVGWTVQSSGDGSSVFSSSGDIITSGDAVTNGFGNGTAWVRLQSPAGAGSRELVFQRASSNQFWNSQYSFSAGFTGGSPSATAAPTATDGQTLMSSTFLFSTDNSYYMQMAADNAAPYGFYLFTYQIGGTSPSSSVSGGLLMDPLLVGTYPASDNDPYVFSFTGNPYSVSFSNVNFGYLKKGLVGEGFVNIPWMSFNTGITNKFFPGGAGNNSFSFKEQTLPVAYARDNTQTAPFGWKGISSLLKWNGQNYANPTLLSISTTRDRVAIADVSFPWNGSKILL